MCYYMQQTYYKLVVTYFIMPNKKQDHHINEKNIKLKHVNLPQE